MAIVVALALIVAALMPVWVLAANVRDVFETQRTAWRLVGEDLGLDQLRPRLGPLGTEGVSGRIDEMNVSVTRPSPLAFWHVGTGDKIAYSIRWHPPGQSGEMKLQLAELLNERGMMGAPVQPGSLDGLRLMKGDADALAHWLTPDREAALESLLSDGAGRRRIDRSVVVTDGELRLGVDWRDRTPTEIATTTRRLLDVAAVLQAGSVLPPSTPVLEEPTLSALDEVAASLQDAAPTPPEPAVSRVGEETTPEAAGEPTTVSSDSDLDDDASSFTIEQAVAELLDRSLMSHEAAVQFDRHHKDRMVQWTGEVTATRAVNNDPDFGRAGVRATVRVFQIDDSPLVTNQVHAIVHLDATGSIAIGQQIHFTGRLHRVDRTMRNFFVAEANVT